MRKLLGALLIPVAVHCGGRSALDDFDDPDAGVVIKVVEVVVDGGAAIDATVTDVAEAAAPSAEVAAPRPIAPLSTATVTSHTPILRWSLPAGATGAEIDICRDRACTTRVTTFTATGTSAPAGPLSQGVYFWRLRGVTGRDVGTTNSAVWELFVGVADTARNSSWGTTLDVNGDGFADVVAGAPNLSGDTENAYLYLGGANGLSSSPTLIAYPNHPNGYYRSPIASAGDVDGDGYADLVIGAPDLHAKEHGAVLVYSGGPNGLATTPKPLAVPSDVDGSFGWSVSSAGDLDGDGYADVIVGAPYTNTNQGAAFVYYGSADGLGTSPTKLTATTLPEGLYAYFGRGVAGIGDIDGDGFADFAIGAIQGNSLFVYFGGAHGLSEPTVIPEPHVPSQPDQNPGFGSTVASAGDVNGDGFADLLAGAPNDGDDYISAGGVYLYLGGKNGLAVTPIALVPPTANSGLSFGAIVAGAGDVDGDGYADLLCATVVDSYLYLGGPNGPSTRPTRLTVPGGENNSFGSGALAGAGDVDGDGFADFLTGSPNSNNYGGAAFFYSGIAKGSADPLPISHPTVANGLFGSALF